MATSRALQVSLVMVRGSGKLGMRVVHGLRTTWNTDRPVLLAVYCFGAVGVLLVAVIGVVVVRTLAESVSTRYLPSVEQFRAATTLPTALAGLCSLAGLWAVLSLVTRPLSIGLVFGTSPFTRLFRFVSRVLASFPTLIVGNALLSIGAPFLVNDRSMLSTILVLVAVFSLVSLPTTLNVTMGVLLDLDPRSLQPGTALGMTRITAANRLIGPTVGRTFRMAILLGITRTLIEGYLVLAQTSLHHSARGQVLRDPADLLSVVTATYSLTTISANVVLIVTLFAFALLANAWALTVTASPRI